MAFTNWCGCSNNSNKNLHEVKALFLAHLRYCLRLCFLSSSSWGSSWGATLFQALSRSQKTQREGERVRTHAGSYSVCSQEAHVSYLFHLHFFSQSKSCSCAWRDDVIESIISLQQWAWWERGRKLECGNKIAVYHTTLILSLCLGCTFLSLVSKYRIVIS